MKIPIDINNEKEFFDIKQYPFNNQQLEAIDKACNFVMGLNEETKAFLISGYAGTGKTYTVSKLIRHFIQNLNLSVAVTAPTNKAVRILRENTEFIHRNMKHLTVHKLLGLKPQIDDRTGKEKFLKDFDAENEISKYDVLVVDEVSMLSDELFHYIWEEVEENNLKVIFMGDPLQIPPVNHLDSIPLLKDNRVKFKIDSVELTQIVRQAADNPILEFATAIRTHYLNKSKIFIPETKLVDRSGILTLSKTNKESIYAICKAFFANEHFKNDPDFMKVISWRNDTVNAVNSKVRQFIYNSTVIPKIMVGEKLIADEPIIGEFRNIIVNTNDEMEVVSYELNDTDVKSYILKDSFNVKYYDVVVSHLDTKNGTPKESIIKIIHEDSELQFNDLLDRLIAVAKRESDTFARRPIWANYYEIKRFFSWVKYNYAITAHKAQGSTYQNSMVLLWDMDQLQKETRNRPYPHIERNRIKYTAVTRPKDLLIPLI